MKDYLSVLDAEINRQKMADRYYMTAQITNGTNGKNGQPDICTHSYHPGNPAHDSYSVAKSVTAIGFGILCDRGLCKPDDRIGDYLSAYLTDGTDPGWGDLTLENVLRHRTGAAYGTDLDLTNAHLFDDPEWLHTFFAAPLDHAPGREMTYSDGNYYIIGRIMEQLTGEDVEKFMLREVFVPLGFHVNAWSRDIAGHTVCGTGLYMRTSDMAKLAWLLLHHGKWGQKQLLSAEFVERMAPPADGFAAYGYGIGVAGNGLGAGGMYGQGWYFNRELQVALAWHSFNTPGLMDICATL